MSYESIIRSMLTMDSAQFKSEIQKAGQTSDSLKAKFGELKSYIAGAFTVSGIIAFGKTVLDTADKIANASERMKILPETFQTIEVVAKRSGVEMGAIEGAVSHLGRAGAEAAEGNKNLAAAFRTLGIDAKSFVGLSVDEKMGVIAKAMYDNRDSVAGTAAAYDLLGRGAGRLIGIMQTLGKDGIEKLKQGFIDMGLVLSNETIKQIDETGDSLEEIGKRFRNFGVDTAGFISRFAAAWGDVSVQVKRYEENNALVNASLEKHERKAREVAATQAEVEKKIKAQADLEAALVEYNNAKAALKGDVILPQEERALMIADKIDELEKEIRDSYESQYLSATERTKKETEILKLRKELKGIHEAMVKELIEEENKRLETQAKIEERILEAERLLAEMQSNNAFERMTQEQQLEVLKDRVAKAQKAVNDMVASGVVKTEKFVAAQIDLESATHELAKAQEAVTKESGNASDNASDAKDSTDGAKDGTTEWREELKNLNAQELGVLITNMNLLQQALQGIAAGGGFPKIELPDLSKFEIPEWMTKGNSVTLVNNFLDALRRLATAQIDTSNLEYLKNLDFKLPDTSKTDLDGLVDILKATEKAKFGAIDIKLNYPEGGIPVDATALKLDGIAESLAVIASMKGVIVA